MKKGDRVKIDFPGSISHDKVVTVLRVFYDKHVQADCFSYELPECPLPLVWYQSKARPILEVVE